MKTFATLLTAATLAALAPSAANAAVNITSIGNSPSALVGQITFAPAGYNGFVTNVGRFSMTGNTLPAPGTPVNYLSYCIDLFSALSTGIFTENQPLTTIVTNATKRDQLVALLGNVDPLITGNTALDQERAAAVQLAIWEIVGEAGSSGYSLSAGTFSVTGTTANTLALAATYLTGVTNGSLQAVPGRDARILLAAQGNQSQIYLSGAVPEPSTWGMMILGFGLIGGALRSRRVTFARA